MSRIKIEEPKFVGTMSTINLISALNWYHQNKESKDAQKYIQDYAKKNKISGRINTSKSYLTLGWLCRIVLNGNTLDEKSNRYIQTNIKKIMEKEVVVEEEVATTVTVSIQDRVREKVAEIAGELEGSIDDYIISKCKDNKSPFAIMQDKAKGMHANRIVEVFKKRRAEFDEVLHTKDNELRNAYSMSKPELKKIIAYIDQIIMDALKIAGEAKATRKPRKRKQKTASQLTAKVKYCVQSDEYKLKSIDPKEIIGATQLWVFNTKTRKLGVYHAMDMSGLAIKGTTITGFSEMKSVQKTLRKPEAILPDIVKGGKVFMRNVMESIRATEGKLTGRLNDDTILIRATK